MTKSALKERQPDLLGTAKDAPAPKLPAKAEKSPKPSRAVAVLKPPAPMSRYELVASLAANPDVDASKMKELLGLLKEEERIEAERAYDEAMLAAQNDMPKIPRNAYNKHTKSWWARIEQVSSICDPIIRKHNFTTNLDLGELPWSMPNLSCRGLSMGYNSTNNSLIFPFQQNGLSGVAEYFLP